MGTQLNIGSEYQSLSLHCKSCLHKAYKRTRAPAEKPCALNLESQSERHPKRPELISALREQGHVPKQATTTPNLLISTLNPKHILKPLTSIICCSVKLFLAESSVIEGWLAGPGRCAA